MAEGGGQQTFKVKVSTGNSVAALDSLTQAAVVARGAIKSLNAAGGQQAMLAAAAAAKANADAQKAVAMASKAVADQARAAAPLLRAQAAADVAAARAGKLNADAAVAQARADKMAADALKTKERATRSASDQFNEGAGKIKGYASQVLDLAQKAGDLAQQLYGLAAEGQKLKQLDTAFKTLGGNDAEMEKLRKATGGVVDDAMLQRVYNLGSLFELPKQHIPELIRLAKGASVALGQTVAKSLEDTFTAASRGSKMIADNMGIVIGDLEPRYAEFAKKAGKSVDSLTDKEKQLVFIQTMIAKGGRQVDLASAASANQFASAEAQITNYTNSLKMSLAETFVSSGAFDAMSAALGTVKDMFAANGDQIAAVVMPAFNAVVQILPHVAGLFGTLLPILKPLTTALGTVSAVLQLITPILGVAVTIIAELANVILQLVNVALMSLLKAIREVASVFSDDMAAGIDKAIKALDQSLPATEAQTEAMKQQQAAIEKVAKSYQFYDEMKRRALVDVGKETKMEDAGEALFAARLGVTSEQLALINADMETFNQQYVARLAYLASSYKQADIAKMSADQQRAIIDNMRASIEEQDKIKDMSLVQLHERLGAMGYASDKLLTLTVEEGRRILEAEKKKLVDLKALEDQALSEEASKLKDRLGLEGAARDDIKRLLKKKMDDAAKAEKDAQDKAASELKLSLRRMNMMAVDEKTFQVSTLADMMKDGAKNEKEAMDKLEAYADQHLANIALVYAGNADEMAKQENILNTLVNNAAEALDKAFTKDKKGARGPDYAKAIEDAKAALMEESERNIYDIKKKYEEMAEKLPKKESELRLALARQTEAEIIDLAEERSKRETELARAANEARRNEKVALSDFLASEEQKRYQQAMRSIAEEAAARRAGAGGDQGQIAQINARQQQLAAQLQAQTLRETFEGAFSERFVQYREEQSKQLERARKDTQHWASTFQSAGSSIVGSMFDIAQGSGDMREQVFKSMGSLFGQLSTAYLAWANTEIAMFSGNPWLGAVAAVALGAVASAISSFGSRGKGGGAGSGGGAGAASREVRNRQNEAKDSAVNVTINAMGMSTPDSIARAVKRGELRGQELTGRSKAT